MNSYRIIGKLQERKAQILLPAVLLAPIFILVIYLLFEIAKVSMTKVRQQFALDNAAYSQMSAASTYLNAVAMVNGPLPYRVLLTFNELDKLKPSQRDGGGSRQPISVFELFYQGGGVPTISPDYDTGINKPPPAESNDWGLRYYSGENLDKEGGDRSGWEKETPTLPSDDKPIPVMSKKLVDHYYFSDDNGKGPFRTVLQLYLETYARTGSIYKSQDYVYDQVSKNAIMFREAYYLNVNDCKRSDCARQSAAQLQPFLALKTKPFGLDKIKFYFSESRTGWFSAGAYDIELSAVELLNGERLFQFAYLDPSSRGKLKSLARGIMLKQPFKLPRNHFNINLEQKYKPYVRNRIALTCPRSSNNCVWPNPLPKYNITLEP
ncbi:MAG: hypothetical protein IKO35_03250 [Elusimicrobiaceae bacterium]|nr:hypothetical protein [Elusimicrobiaceae bacterium]